MLELDNVVVGRPRPKRHAIIVRHEVGRAPQRACSPAFPETKTYGAQVRRDPESAGDVVLSWRGHVPSKSAQAGGKRFVQLNIKAAGARCITPAHITSFRKDYCGQRPRSCSPLPRAARLAAGSGLATTQPIGVLPPVGARQLDALAFGTSTKQGVSVGDLISHKFANEWVTEQTTLQQQRDVRRRMDHDQREKRRENALVHLLGKQARADEGLEQYNRNRFTLKRFRNVASRTESKRPDEGPDARPRPQSSMR